MYNQRIIEISKRRGNNTDIRKYYYGLKRMKFNRTLLIVFGLFGLVPPLMFRALNWYNGKDLGTLSELVQTLMISSFTTIVISYCVVSVLYWLQQNYPWQKGVFTRLILEILMTTTTACAIILLLTIIHNSISPFMNLQNELFSNSIIAVIMNFCLVGITEGIFFFRQWKHSEVETERFKKDSVIAQFESLRNQVNPHFLFNSLNTLSSLIDHDKEMSKEFLDDLSSVYRYVLQHKDEEVVSVKTEINFIHAFVNLLKKRHGQGLSFQFEILENDYNKYIPPMSIQMLVENAVKHNIASRKKPLTIKISSDNHFISVKNNLQLKNFQISTGIGLDNIKSRYKYLTAQDVNINRTNDHFEVKIPIVEAEQSELK